MRTEDFLSHSASDHQPVHFAMAQRTAPVYSTVVPCGLLVHSYSICDVMRFACVYFV